MIGNIIDINRILLYIGIVNLALLAITLFRLIVADGDRTKSKATKNQKSIIAKSLAGPRRLRSKGKLREKSHLKRCH